jgi:hypothetical protein
MITAISDVDIAHKSTAMLPGLATVADVADLHHHHHLFPVTFTRSDGETITSYCISYTSALCHHTNTVSISISYVDVPSCIDSDTI